MGSDGRPAAVLGHTLTQLEQGLAGATGSRDDVRRAWATALALGWLREHASDTEDQWRLLAAKAARYLSGVTARAAGYASWTDAASEFLGRMRVP